MFTPNWLSILEAANRDLRAPSIKFNTLSRTCLCSKIKTFKTKTKTRLISEGKAWTTQTSTVVTPMAGLETSKLFLTRFYKTTQGLIFLIQTYNWTKRTHSPDSRPTRNIWRHSSNRKDNLVTLLTKEVTRLVRNLQKSKTNRFLSHPLGCSSVRKWKISTNNLSQATMTTTTLTDQ